MLSLSIVTLVLATVAFSYPQRGPPQQQFAPQFAPQQFQGQPQPGFGPPQQSQQQFGPPAGQRLPPPQHQQGFQPPQGPQGPPPEPVIEWGMCPQLAPSESEKEEKGKIVKECLERIEVPENFTREAMDLHRGQVAYCALSKEGWFVNGDSGYNYDKAFNEIKSKGLKKDVQEKIIRSHNKCKDEAEKIKEDNYPLKEVTLYQSCMDYHISMDCEIRITAPQQ